MHVFAGVGLRQSKMREMLEELRNKLGMPLDAEAECWRDYGYRSTVIVHDSDLSSEVNVPVQHAGSPFPYDVGRSPQLPRHGHYSSCSHDVAEMSDCGSQRVNVLTIDDQYDAGSSTCRSSFDVQRRDDCFVDSDGGWDETDGLPTTSRGRVTPPSGRSPRSVGDRPVSSRRSRRHRRRKKTSLSPVLSVDQADVDPCAQPLEPDSVPNGANTDDRPSPDDGERLALDRTRAVEMTGDSENRDIELSGRDLELEDGAETSDRRGDDVDDDDSGSYGAYDGHEEEFLDTLSEYQQKLEKTNFVDEAEDDSVGDAVTDLDRTASVPLPRRNNPVTDEPELASATVPDSPSDSLDVSELEEDDYLE